MSHVYPRSSRTPVRLPEPCPECGEHKPWHATSCSHAQSQRRWPVMLTERQVGILVGLLRADTTCSAREYAELYDHLCATETGMHNEVNSGVSERREHAPGTAEEAFPH